MYLVVPRHETCLKRCRSSKLALDFLHFCVPQSEMRAVTSVKPSVNGANFHDAKQDPTVAESELTSKSPLCHCRRTSFVSTGAELAAIASPVPLSSIL
jgi:hypothetical protein